MPAELRRRLAYVVGHRSPTFDRATTLVGAKLKRLSPSPVSAQGRSQKEGKEKKEEKKGKKKKKRKKKIEK